MISDALEHFEERAAVMEFDGGLPREEAERLALEEVSARWGEGVALLVSPDSDGKSGRHPMKARAPAGLRAFSLPAGRVQGTSPPARS